MKKILSIVLLCCPLIFAFGQFSATMMNTVQGKERIYKVYSDLENYRYEFEESGSEGIVIVRPAEKKTFVLMPEKKSVYSTTCDGSMSRTNDPWQAYQWYKNFGREVDLGNTTIQGYPCKKLAVYQNETKVFSANYSEKLNFPLSIKSELEESTYMSLTGIKKWNPDPEMFKVPENYTEVDRRGNPVIPEPPAPEIWTETKGSLPFKGTIKRGEKVRIPLDESCYYKLKAVNKGNSPGKFIYHAFVDGEKIPVEQQGMEKYRTFRLFPGQPKTLTQDWKSDYEVLIEVYEGALEFEVFKE